MSDAVRPERHVRIVGRPIVHKLGPNWRTGGNVIACGRDGWLRAMGRERVALQFTAEPINCSRRACNPEGKR